MRELELLAPARDKQIGIAAIDCGADAVYIAGPAFGARKDASNSIEDIRELCSYAHMFGARIFMTVNTILFQEELQEAHAMMLQAQDAGVDAFIIQDQAIWQWKDIRVPLHASTQCAIRDVDTARYYSSLGSGRLVLERQISLERIKEIASSVETELEFFVHGALCVSYSGNCYLSESLSGRSANRGACIQACRSLYDLVDEDGRVIEKNKALLSLKDYNLSARLEDLAQAGISSFKIEGRLKNASYVKNVVREYSLALDRLIEKHPDLYRRSSWGRISTGFTPDVSKTFNRAYTELYIDGQRGSWSSMDAPKSMGEFIGTISSIRKIDRYQLELTIKTTAGVSLSNGDGFSIPAGNGIAGFRGDICKGNTIICKSIPQIRKGVKIWRNFGADFEKELERQVSRREIPVELQLTISGKYDLEFRAISQDGREILSSFKTDLDTAENKERAEALCYEQLSKRSGHYIFSLKNIDILTKGGNLPLLSASTLNSMRRLLAEDLDRLPVNMTPLNPGTADKSVKAPQYGSDHLWNLANSEAEAVLRERGGSCGKAYELDHRPDARLMTSKYCIRHELGMCPVHQGAKSGGRLFLVNNGRRFPLEFDCRNCEMSVLSDNIKRQGDISQIGRASGILFKES